MEYTGKDFVRRGIQVEIRIFCLQAGYGFDLTPADIDVCVLNIYVFERKNDLIGEVVMKYIHI